MWITEAVVDNWCPVDRWRPKLSVRREMVEMGAPPDKDKSASAVELPSFPGSAQAQSGQSPACWCVLRVD
jgi:hypothetical protein